MAETNSAPQQFSLTIRYSGGLADTANLQLSEYASSLTGWQQFFRLASDLLIRSDFQLPDARPSDIFQIRVGVEREGSFETVVQFILNEAAKEFIKRAAGVAYESFAPRLKKWFKSLIVNHVGSKGRTTDVEQLAAMLNQMAAANAVGLETHGTGLETAFRLIESDDDREEEEDDAEAPQASKARQLTEKIDEQLKLATEPLDNSCTRIEVTDEQGTPLVSFGAAERAIITDPLTLPPPKRDWVKAAVRFKRIHDGTGRAMFYFRDEGETTHGAHYSKIIDPCLRQPRNPYTTAFNDKTYLDVWVRQRPPQKGRLQVQWDITVEPPTIQYDLRWPDDKPGDG